MRPAEKPSPLWQAICEALPVFRPTDEQIVQVAGPWLRDREAIMDLGYRPKIVLSMHWRLHPLMQEAPAPTDEAIVAAYRACVENELRPLSGLLAEPRMDSLSQLAALLGAIENKARKCGHIGLSNEVLWILSSFRPDSITDYGEADIAEMKALHSATSALISDIKSWITRHKRLYPNGRPYMRRQIDWHVVDSMLKELGFEEHHFAFHHSIIQSIRFGGPPYKGGRPGWSGERVRLRFMAALLLAAGYSPSYGIPKMVGGLFAVLPVLHRSASSESIRGLLKAEPITLDRLLRSCLFI
jgi:hypothetical protein